MSAHDLPRVLVALEIAAFSRAADGSFVALAPTPDWFTRITSDTTFPFLGHILEEAGLFWRSGEPGSRQWGPCAEVNESGEEYHYMVSALVADGGQYLVFQLDPGADRMRELLQKVRSEALSAERDLASFAAIVAEMRRTNNGVKELLAQLVVSDLTPKQLELVNTLASKCVMLMGGASKLIRATTLPRI
jgi:hypothetical protein